LSAHIKTGWDGYESRGLWLGIFREVGKKGAATDKRRRKTLLRATNKDDADIVEPGLVVSVRLWILYGSGYGSAAEMRDSGTMGSPNSESGGGYKNKQSKRAAEGVIEVGVSKQ